MLASCDCCGRDKPWKGIRRLLIRGMEYMVCADCQRNYLGPVIRQRVLGEVRTRARHAKIPINRPIKVRQKVM